MADQARRGPGLEDWRKRYRDMLATPEVAAGAIQSGDNLFLPNAYLGVLPPHIVARKAELRNVTVEICTPLYDPGWLSPGMEESFDIVVRIFLHLARAAHDEGRIPYLPYTNGTWIKPHRDQRPARREIDVFTVEVSPPDEQGRCYFGQGVWESLYYARNARTVIGECDEYFIKTHGESFLHVSEFDYLVDVTVPALSTEELDLVVGRMDADKRERARHTVAQMQPRIFRSVLPVIDLVPVEILEELLNLVEPTEVMKAMADNLKAVLRDRDTIQIGIGKHTKHLVELGAFDHLNDLSLFSEMGCPGMGFMVRRGIASGSYSTLHPGKAVFSSLLGMTPEEIRWADDNPSFELYPGEYVINIANISRNENQVAINNAVQVDLTGQITCESQFGPRLINGAGGQVEFHIGAFLSRGGRAVTMLPSTYRDGAASNIVPYFEKGTLVTLSRYWADYIVTEWGVADLAGRTHRERAEALVEIAHPDYRDELREAARQIC